MDDGTFMSLESLIDAVRDRMQEVNNNNNSSNAEPQGVETVMAAVVAEHYPNLDTLELDVVLNGEMEETIFDALLSHSKIQSLVITPDVEASSLEGMLRKAVMALPNLLRVEIANALTEPQMERILSILRTSSTLDELFLFLGICGDGIAKPIRKYLEESTTLRVLAMTWGGMDEDYENPPLPVSQAAFSQICSGIGESRSLGYAILAQPPFDCHDVNFAAGSLALAATKSVSLQEVVCIQEHRAFLGKVRNYLTRTPAIQNFELCFSQQEDAPSVSLNLNRNAPFKPLLSKDIPLALFPRILAKTKAWDKEDSHSPFDALFYLMSEKNDVLLQNVHRRKIRKRKRFQFES